MMSKFISQIKPQENVIFSQLVNFNYSYEILTALLRTTNITYYALFYLMKALFNSVK